MSDLLNLSDYEKLYRETLKEMKEKALKTNYKSAREISNEIALESPFGKRSLLFKPDFVSKNIDFIKLSEFIKANTDAEFDYKAFIGTATRNITQTISFGEEAKFDRMAGVPTRYNTSETYETEVPLSEKTFSGERTLQLHGKLYTEKGNVNIHKDSESDITSGLEFEFDFTRKIVNYKIHFYFVGKKRVYENDNTDNIAFTVSSSNYEDFHTFLKLINRKYTDDSFENKIEVAFLDAIKQLSKLKDEDSYYAQKYNPLKFKNLDWLYQNIPYFVAAKLDFNETVANVFKLNKWDKASIRNDSTAGITGILQKLDSRSVYIYFYKNPEKLITLLNGFDDDELVKNFCAYLTIITFLYTGQDIEKARKFSVGENTHIETNILYGDEKGKVELRNELQLPTIGFNGLNFINLFASDVEINNPGKSSNQFHPLDIIYITNYNSATGEEEKYPTIALYGKFLGDKSEWNDVKDALFAVVDVLSMLISFGVISAGIRGVARLFAIIDITISTINLALLNPDLRNRLNKTEAGKWFVSHWGIISFCVSMGTISYYLAKGIVKYGEQVKQQLRNEKELSKQIDGLVENSKRVVGDINNFIAKHLKPISTGGLRGEISLTEIEKLDILNYAKKYGIKEEDIFFKNNDLDYTSYARLFGEKDVLYINTDVMPALNPTSANSKVSWKGAIAHELEGHRAAALNNKTHSNDLLEEVQASLRASVHGKDLTKLERQILREDALERLEKNNIKLEEIIETLWLEKN